MLAEGMSLPEGFLEEALGGAPCAVFRLPACHGLSPPLEGRKLRPTGVGWGGMGRFARVAWLVRASTRPSWAWRPGAGVQHEAAGRLLGQMERVMVSCGRGSHRGC